LTIYFKQQCFIFTIYTVPHVRDTTRTATRATRRKRQRFSSRRSCRFPHNRGVSTLVPNRASLALCFVSLNCRTLESGPVSRHVLMLTSSGCFRSSLLFTRPLPTGQPTAAYCPGSVPTTPSARVPILTDRSQELPHRRWERKRSLASD